jgi:hypothetical protein
MEIRQGHYYSNGAYGRSWGVRMVVAIGPDAVTREDMVHFKGVAGSSRRQTGDLPVDEFLRWAKYEVRLVENDWKRVDEPKATNIPLPAREGGEAG